MRTSKLVALVVGALAIPFLGIAAFIRWDARALPRPDAATYRQLWSSGVAYDAFVAGDTARRAQWIANHAAAATSMAPLVDRARAIGGRWHLLVVAESWCSDAVNSVPYLVALAAADPSLDVRLLRKGDAKRLLRSHLLDGRDATPLVIVLDSAFVERGSWVEQPSPLKALVRELEPTMPKDSLRVRVRAWYAADSGRTSVGEVLALIEGRPGEGGFGGPGMVGAHGR